MLATKEIKKKLDVYYIKGDYIIDVNSYNVLNKCEINKQYSIIIRLSYISIMDNKQYYTEWRTLGEQIPFKYDSISDLNLKLEDIKSVILDRLMEKLELYQVEYNNVLGIQLLVYNVDTNKTFKKINNTIDSLGIHKDLINVKSTKDTLGFLPLTKISDSISKLEKVINKNIFIGIKLSNGTIYDINTIISNNFDDRYDFYQITKKDISYIVTSFIENNTNYINLYNMKGYKITSVIDHYDEDIIIRRIGNIDIHIKKGLIINKEIHQDFKAIKPKKLGVTRSKMEYSDYRIGTLDLETYIDRNDVSKVYSIGYYTKNKCKMFYIKNDLNSSTLIMECLDSMLVERNNNYTFYVHNFSGFDVYFLLKIIINAQNKNPDIYSYNLIMKDAVIICINMSKIIKTSKSTKKYTIKLVDSYNILKASLNDLCKTYNPKVHKSIFPYKFVRENTLFYNGIKPDQSYYNISNKEYNGINKFNWSTELETKKYLEKDLISLYDIMSSFNKHVWLEYDIHITNSYTISGISMEVFLNKYYHNNIPLITKKSVHNNIRQSYYGGITEVYIPYGENLYYYDVNSLYPYAALNTMPGINCKYIENINKNINDYLDIFGFYKCEIITNNNYLGLLPVRLGKGVIMPEGNIKGWYFSEELKFAHSNGYKINILSGYEFEKSNNTFKDYVKHFYNIKEKTNDKIEKSTAKSFLNNLLGRFGLNINKPITKIVNYDEFVEILKTRVYHNHKEIDDKILVTYENDISPRICESYGDFKESYNNSFNTSSSSISKEETSNVSVSISSAITSYSRIFMNKLKLDILNKGGNIYYTDTDSIVTNIPLKDDLIGSGIGKFKLEYNIKKGYFLSNKTYCLVLNDNSVITKVKGVNSVVTLNDFIKLYEGSNINTTRFETYKNISEGYVNINQPRNITLYANSYTKREKVFDKNNKWINTKPLKVSHFKRDYSTYRSVNDNTLFNITLIKKVIKYSLFMILLILAFITYIIFIIFNIENDISFENIKTICSFNNYNHIPNIRYKHIKINNWHLLIKDYEKVEYLKRLKNPTRTTLNCSVSDKLLENSVNNLIKENNILNNQIKYYKNNENINILFHKKLSNNLEECSVEFKLLKNKMNDSLDEYNKIQDNLFYDSD